MLYKKNYLELIVLQKVNDIGELLLILNEEIEHLTKDLKYSFDNTDIKLKKIDDCFFVTVDDMEFSDHNDLKENLKDAILFLEEENFEKEVG